MEQQDHESTCVSLTDVYYSSCISRHSLTYISHEYLSQERDVHNMQRKNLITKEKEKEKTKFERVQGYDAYLAVKFTLIY